MNPQSLALEVCSQQTVQHEKKAARKEMINQFHPKLFEEFDEFLNCNNYLLLGFLFFIFLFFLYLPIVYVENLLIKLFHPGFEDSFKNKDMLFNKVFLEGEI